MESVQDTLQRILTKLSSEVELQFRAKYFALFASPPMYFYHIGYVFVSPAYNVSCIHKHTVIDEPISPALHDAFSSIDDDFKMYITMRDKVESALIDLSNRTSPSNFIKLMGDFNLRFEHDFGSTIEGHPFWALYKKQKLINKVWL